VECDGSSVWKEIPDRLLADIQREVPYLDDFPEVRYQAAVGFRAYCAAADDTVVVFLAPSNRRGSGFEWSEDGHFGRAPVYVDDISLGG